MLIGVSFSINSAVVNSCCCYLFRLESYNIFNNEDWNMLVNLSPCHLCWKKEREMLMWWHTQHVRFITSTARQACHASYMMKCLSDFLLDPNTQSLINPVFILVNPGTPPTCQPLWHHEGFCRSFSAEWVKNFSKHVFLNLMRPSKFLLTLFSVKADLLSFPLSWLLGLKCQLICIFRWTPTVPSCKLVASNLLYLTPISPHKLCN